MKKLTIKQRAAIYLKVANYLEQESPSFYFLCGELSRHSGVEYGQVMQVFDEFVLFMPDRNEGGSLWWAEDEFGLSVRITCMLLCYEMIQNQIE